MPIHVLLRLVLERCGTARRGARRCCSAAPASASSCVTVAAAERAAARSSPSSSARAARGVVGPDADGWLVHTNHFLVRPARGRGHRSRGRTPARCCGASTSRVPAARRRRRGALRSARTSRCRRAGLPPRRLRPRPGPSGARRCCARVEPGVRAQLRVAGGPAVPAPFEPVESRERRRSRSPSTWTARRGCRTAARGYAQRLSSRSERLYGVRRGLPRILALLAEHGVPGDVLRARRHRGAPPGRAARDRRRRARGRPSTGTRTGGWTADRRRAARGARGRPGGARALTGARPLGYRAPRVGADAAHARAARRARVPLRLEPDGRRPARTRVAPARATLVELPVHWSLDDAPHYARRRRRASSRVAWR